MGDVARFLLDGREGGCSSAGSWLVWAFRFTLASPVRWVVVNIGTGTFGPLETAVDAWDGNSGPILVTADCRSGLVEASYLHEG